MINTIPTPTHTTYHNAVTIARSDLALQSLYLCAEICTIICWKLPLSVGMCFMLCQILFTLLGQNCQNLNGKETTRSCAARQEMIAIGVPARGQNPRNMLKTRGVFAGSF